ncbi:MAG: DNA methyltransferase [Parasphingorhabdus sp.]
MTHQLYQPNTNEDYRNRIFNGDATQQLKKLPADSIDLVLTDVPYLIGYRDRLGRTVANDTNPDGVLPSFPEMYRVLKNDSYAIIFCGWSAIDQFSTAWTQAGFRTVGQIFWKKPYASSKWHTEARHESAWLLAKGRPAKPAHPVSDVQEWTYSGNRFHPTEKSIEVLKPVIEAYSNKGDIVLDPFAGSGGTCVAASLKGRDYIGIELEKEYCEHTKRRLAGVSSYRAK